MKNLVSRLSGQVYDPGKPSRRKFLHLIAANFGFIALLAQGVAVAVFSSAACALSPEDIVGTWRLVSNVRQTEGNDKIENNLGENPSGLLILTREHRFIVLFTAADRKPSSTTEGLAALQNTHIAYSGLVTFEPDPSDASRLKMTNKVDIAWNAAWAGTTQVRFLSLEGNRLTIKTPLTKNAITGKSTISTLVFERSK